jgi:uncharacterized membrane protein YcaP (DUF421 family)
MNEILSIVLRSATVYICIVLLIRIFGKKELSQISVVDLVFILLISNSVQNAMVGNSTSLWGGLIAAATLFLLNTLLRLWVYYFKPAEKFFEGEPVVLIYEGRIIQKNLEKEKISISELDAVIREHGVSDVKHVNLAILETDGNISVLSKDFKIHTRNKRKHHKVLKTGN